jgi:hypothetical protein
MDTSVFGASPQDLLLTSGTLALKRGFCASNGAGVIESCRDANIQGLQTNAFTAGFEVITHAQSMIITSHHITLNHTTPHYATAPLPPQQSWCEGPLLIAFLPLADRYSPLL